MSDSGAQSVRLTKQDGGTAELGRLKLKQLCTNPTWATQLQTPELPQALRLGRLRNYPFKSRTTKVYPTLFIHQIWGLTWSFYKPSPSAFQNVWNPGRLLCNDNSSRSDA